MKQEINKYFNSIVRKNEEKSNKIKYDSVVHKSLALF